MQIDYTAKRSLASGHSVDTDYTINVDLSQSDRIRKTEGSQLISLSGSTVTTVHRRERIYSFKTIFISDSSTPANEDMIEFLDSIMSGEEFEIDISGALEPCIIDSVTSPYTANRTSISSEYFTYSFRVRML